MNEVQARAAHLCFRCYTGFDKMDKEKKRRIDQDQAIVEWTEFLSKRVKQDFSGGAKFVFEICRIVKEKQTPKGLDLGDRPALLEKLANWAAKKSKPLVEAAACCIFKYMLKSLSPSMQQHVAYLSDMAKILNEAERPNRDQLRRIAKLLSLIHI